MAFYVAVNHAREMLVIFSPKCGSNAIRKWFIHTLDKKPRDGERDFHEHMIALQAMGDYPRYRTVFFVRNPFRRLVSFYSSWVVRNNTHWCFADDQQRFPLHDKSFGEFLHILDHLWTRKLDFQHHLKPQTEGLAELSFDHVVTLENLDADMQALNASLGLDYVPPRSNATPYSTHVEVAADTLKPDTLRNNGIPACEYFYDVQLAEIVCRIYERDVAFYRQQVFAAANDGCAEGEDNGRPDWKPPKVTSVVGGVTVFPQSAS